MLVLGGGGGGGYRHVVVRRKREAGETVKGRNPLEETRWRDLKQEECKMWLN